MKRIITSNENPLYKHLLMLTLKKGRDAAGEFIVEGAKFVKEAIDSGDVKVIAMSQSYAEKDSGAVRSFAHKTAVFSDNLFNNIATTVSTSGILAVCAKSGADMEVLFDAPLGGKLYVIIEDMQDPGNLGAVIRVADAAGADAVLLSAECVELYNPKVLRGSAGSVFHLPIIENADLPLAIRRLKENGVKVYAGHLSGAVYPYNLDLKESAAFVIGSEAHGLRRETADLTDVFVKLPIPGKAESLNAAVAAGIFLYEAVRQRL